MLVLRAGDRDYRVTMDEDGAVSVDGGAAIPVTAEGPAIVRVGHDRRRGWVASSGARRLVFLNGEAYEFEVQDGRRRRAAASAHAPLTSPMPATVVRVDAVPGARVRKGDTLLILEAMKMENEIQAPADGTIDELFVEAGQTVEAGADLVHVAS